MNFQETIKHIDELLKNSRLDAAEKLISESISEAQRDGDTDAEKYLLNEQIGFYRDCGKFPEAISSAEKARTLFEDSGDTESISYATTLLNCANAYRAAGLYDDAFSAYNSVKKLYDKLLPANDGRIASFYNNIALLYQQTEQWDKACLCLESALALVRKENDEIRTAISCSNLAVSLLRLNNTSEALKLLEEADSILAGRSPSDFHYSAVLSGFGDAYYQLSKYQTAADYYEQALSEIELHMGRNNFYDIVSDNLEQSYEKLGGTRPKLTGLELSRKFFEAFGKPMLKRNFTEILPYVAAGLAGEGSECLGYDDEISQDHDFGAGFCIWISNDVSQETANKLQNAYDALPKTYYGIKRIETKNAKNRVGVCRTSDFLQRLIGIKRLPQTEQEWLDADEAMLSAVCSGEIFMDNCGEITSLRAALNKGYPEPVRLRRLAQQLALMAQSGQYNYIRMRKRSDFASAQLYLSKFCKCAMQAAHLCKKVYAPYEKWLVRSTSELGGFKEYADKIKKLLIYPPQTTFRFDEKTDPVCVLIQEICQKIACEASAEEFMENNVYLEKTAENLADKAASIEHHQSLVERIVQLEWQAFDKVQNIGGRASCQDDWETFSIMRRSQYLTWQTDLLENWVEEFEYAYKHGRNLITEKYARMMESTDPEKYLEIKKNLPEIPEDFIKIREAIVNIQVSWMDEFAKRYPNLASNARTIHTENDSVFQTSYETYLRGELTTYSFDMLYKYGRWITNLYKNKQNLAFMIMTETVHAYGFKSLDDAEK